MKWATVRLTEEESTSLDALVKESGLTRMTYMREMVRMATGLARITPARMGFRIRRD